MVAAPAAPKKGKKGKNAKKAVLQKKLRNALGEMPEALRSEITDVLDDVAELDSSDIQKRYDIGVRLNSLINDDSGKYGVDAKRAITNVLRLSKDSIAGMAKVASSFEQSDLDGLTAMSNPVTNERLRWHHIVFLARVPDKSKAFTFAQRAIDEGWTTKDLGRAIIRSSGGAKSAGGRKPKRHETLEHNLSEMIQKCRALSNSIELVWAGPDGVSSQFDKEIVSVDGTPPVSMLRQLSEAVDEGTRLGMQTAALNQVLIGLKTRAEAIRSSKQVKA